MTKVYLQTYGCSLNSSDSERIAGILKKSGFQIVESMEDAEVIIVNSCTVKTPTVNKIKRFLNECNKKVILAGCIPQADPDFMEDVSMIGPSQIENIVEVVEETLNGNIVKLLVPDKENKIGMPIVRRNKIVEVLPISEGCLGDPCTYCIVKKARGELRSYPKDAIVNRVKIAVSEGVKEIWLTAQDTGCYGYDIGTNIVELLNEVLAIKGEFRVRLGMTNPDHVKENMGLIDVFKNPKMFQFLHVPVQSGNDEVLKKMHRKYSAQDFREIVEKFREELPLVTIATDVICGFPEETDSQFKDSIELVREIKPDVLNMSKFWLRPGTAAENMVQVSGEDIRDRTKLMSEIFAWVLRDKNKKWVGKRCRVIVDEKGKEDTMIARNEGYISVILRDVKIGQFLDVDIIDHSRHDVIGKIV